MTVKAGIMQNEPRAKCRFCSVSFAALYRLSTGEVRAAMDALEQHVMLTHDELLTETEFRALFGKSRQDIYKGSAQLAREALLAPGRGGLA